MLFNSHEFIFIFLPITFFVYFYLNHKRLTEASKAFLVCSSLFFYSWWDVTYLPIMLTSMVFNYATGRSLNKVCKNQNKGFSKKSILIFGIVFNLSLLGYFKYTDFLIENFNFVFNSNAELLHLALPLAISFFTFQQIAYLVDSYRQETEEYDFLNYALFVTFFPQLIAGPIVHHKEMMPQFAKIGNKVKNYRNIAMGLFIFSIGLFKKVVIADTFAVWATKGFDIATTLNLFEAWTTSLSYTFQLYFDFSGYTDMAIGLALFFNIRLPINFNSPYKATNIQNFWERWHITLSRFFREYLWDPLSLTMTRYAINNKYGDFGIFSLTIMIPIIFSFFWIGLWHGAGWNFIIFGLMHGIALIIYKVWNTFGFKLWAWFGWFVTFNFVNIAWIFFRAKEWDDAIKVLSSMFSLDNIVLPFRLENKLPFLSSYGIEFGAWAEGIGGDSWTAIWIIIGFVLVLIFDNSIQRMNNLRFNYRTVLLAVFTFIFSILSLDKVSEFLYFNF